MMMINLKFKNLIPNAITYPNDTMNYQSLTAL